MPQTLEEYLNSLPEWHDETKILGLFSAFAESREINPEVWDSRLQFWKKLIIQANKLSLLGPDSLVLRTKNLESRFERNGVAPLGISKVLDEMRKEGLLVDSKSYNSTLYYWIFETFLKKPVIWGLKKFVSYNFDGVSEECIIVNLVPELASKVVAEHAKTRAHAIDDILTFADFVKLIQAARCLDASVSNSDFEIILRFMQANSLIEVSTINEDLPMSPDNLVVKIAHKSKNGINENSKGIVKIKLSMQKIDNQIIELSSKMKLLKSETASFLKGKNRQMALISLKREKLLKTVQQKRFQSYSLLEEILVKIKATQMDAEVVDVLSIASKTLGNVIKDSQLSVDKVDELMDGLQDVLADHKEIDEALVAGLGQANDIDDETLEKELFELVSDNVPVTSQSQLNFDKFQSLKDSQDILNLLEQLEVTSTSATSPPLKTNETSHVIEQLDRAAKLQYA